MTLEKLRDSKYVQERPWDSIIVIGSTNEAEVREEVSNALGYGSSGRANGFTESSLLIEDQLQDTRND
jgi:hypothetical protein